MQTNNAIVFTEQIAFHCKKRIM